jgi:hypothetical protein
MGKKINGARPSQIVDIISDTDKIGVKKSLRMVFLGSKAVL